MANDPHFEVYPRRREYGRDLNDNPVTGDLTGEFGWRFQAANGKISAVGGEGFTREEDAERAIREHVAGVYSQMWPEEEFPAMAANGLAEATANRVKIVRVDE